MTTRTAILSAAALSLLSAPLHAESSESLRQKADNLSATFDSVPVPARPAPKPPLVRRARFIPRPEPLPENCANLPVVSIRNGEILKNGAALGRNASNYQANCDGLVVWQNFYGDLYRESQKVADRVSQYDVAWHGDALAWKDTGGGLHLGGDDLGRVESYVFVKYTGDVVWKDSWGDLYRNREKFGRASSYAVAARTGDVAWLDGFGTLHRNDLELGRSQSWQIADRTGDVAWLDSFRNLHKNGAKVGADVSQFSFREDGKLIWVDSWGNTHSA